MTGPFDPLALLSVLRRHGVPFIVIRGFAGNVWRSPTVTNDLDICYDRSTDAARASLVAALEELGAWPREWPEGVPFALDERTIRLGDTFTFETKFGNLDCLATPGGTTGYSDLARNARSLDLGGGLAAKFTSLDDLMRMKRAASRPKDRIELEVLAALAEEREKLPGAE